MSGTMCRRPCSVSFCPFSIPRGLVPLFTMRFRCLPAMLQASSSDESGQSARKQGVFFFRDFFPSSFGVCVMMIDDCDDGSEPESCSSLSSDLVCFYPQISTFLHTPRHGQLADNRSVTGTGLYHWEKRYFQEFFTPLLIFTRFRIFFAFFLRQPTHCTRTDDDDGRFPHNTLSLSLSMKFFLPPAQI